MQFFSVFCRRCQLSVLVTALWLSPTPSIPGGSVDERGCPASHSGSPPPARHSCRLWAARPLVHCRVWPSGPLPCWGWRMPQPRCRLCPCVQSLLPSGAAGPARLSPACRPPIGRLDAWTRLHPRPSRGPSRAHPRPLEGAPPGPLLGVSLALLAHSPSSGCHPLVQSRDRALGLRGTHVVKLSVFKPRFPCARVTPLRVSCLLSVLPRSSFFMCAPSISSGSLCS